MKLRFVSILFVLSMVICAFAQDKQRPAPKPQHPDVPNLTDAQRDQIRQLVQSRKTDADPIVRVYTVARRAKLDSMIATPPDEVKIRAACADFAKADADLSVFISKLYNDILPLLTDEQRGWLKDNREALVRYLQLQIEHGPERLEQRQKQAQ